MKNRSLYTEANIQILVDYCDHYIHVFDTFVHENQVQNLDPIQTVTADMLSRSRTTMEGLKVLLPLLVQHPNHKMNIFLILRSIASDILTYLSLMTFYDGDDENQTAFKNEVDWLDLDFLKAMLKLHDLNNELTDFEGISQLVSSSDTKKNEAIKKELLKTYSHLLNSQGKPKSLKEVRSTTNNKHFKLNPGKKVINLSNEKDKYERILTFPSYNSLAAPVYTQFKYFSQFQHYSRGSMFFFEHHHLDYEIVNILVLFTCQFTVADSQYKIVTAPENKYSKMLKLLDDILYKLFLKL